MGPSLQDIDTPSELDSIVQPGHLVLEYEFPPEMQGTLTTTGVSLSDGAYADVYKGTWTQKGKPEVIVAIKCIRRIAVGEDQRFMTVRQSPEHASKLTLLKNSASKERPSYGKKPNTATLCHSLAIKL